jgi:hypothetical protein
LKHEVRGFRGIDPVILARFRAFLQKKYGKVHGLQGPFMSEALREWLDKQVGQVGVVVENVESPSSHIERIKLSKRTIRNIERIRLLLIADLKLTPETAPEFIQQIVLSSFISNVIFDYRYRRKYIGLLEELGYIEPDIRDGIPVYKLNRQWLFPEKPNEEVVVV